jgi:Flp pilus assembly protein CpaB
MDQKRKQLLFGAVLAGVAVVMTQLYIESEVDRWKPKEFVEVSVASKPIPSGTVLTPGLVKKVSIPKQYAPVTSIQSSQIEQFFGQNLAQDILPDDYILEGSFAVRRSVAEYLSEQIQGDGARAITIPVTETSSLASSIRAGDLVDVVYSFPVANTNSQMTSLLLQNVLVVSTGGYSSEDVESGGAGRGYNSITLQLNVTDALKLKYAEKNGSIDLLLRKRSDTSSVQLSSIANVQDILSSDDSKRLSQLSEAQKDGPMPEEIRNALAAQMKNYEGLSKGLSR